MVITISTHEHGIITFYDKSTSFSNLSKFMNEELLGPVASSANIFHSMALFFSSLPFPPSINSRTRISTLYHNRVLVCRPRINHPVNNRVLALKLKTDHPAQNRALVLQPRTKNYSCNLE